VETLGWYIPPVAATDYVRYVQGGGGPSALESFDGHTFKVEHVGATLSYNNVVYELQEFHLHSLSEHTFNGEHYDLEIQFVHNTKEAFARNKILIVSAFFQVAAGHGSAVFIRDLVSAIPRLKSTPTALVPVDFAQVAQAVMIGDLPHRGSNDKGLENDKGFTKFGVNGKDFAPNFKNYMAYEGSYTAPPCYQGVQWLLLRNPLYIYGTNSQKSAR
jgi:carbonic anhydrase